MILHALAAACLRARGVIIRSIAGTVATRRLVRLVWRRFVRERALINSFVLFAFRVACAAVTNRPSLRAHPERASHVPSSAMVSVTVLRATMSQTAAGPADNYTPRRRCCLMTNDNSTGESKLYIQPLPYCFSQPNHLIDTFDPQASIDKRISLTRCLTVYSIEHQHLRSLLMETYAEIIYRTFIAHDR